MDDVKYIMHCLLKMQQGTVPRFAEVFGGGQLHRFTVFPDFNNEMAVRVFTLVGVYTCCVLLFRR